MASHLELLTELQQLDKVPSLERLRAAQKRRMQQLKRWAVYEKEMQNKKRKGDKRRGHWNLRENRKRVSFAASIALLEASSRNDPDEVRYLLKNNVSPDLCNEDGLTALHQSLMIWCLRSGADLLAVNSDGNMPYDLCEDDPTLDIIETAMANRGITQEMINETRAAVERRMLGDIQNLLQDGADVNRHDSQGATLLHVAAANGFAQVAEMLLEGGARTEMRDSDGWTPLHAAACWGQVHVAELLVSHGADLNAKTYLEETPIDLWEGTGLGSSSVVVITSHSLFFGCLCRKVVRRASVSDRHNLCRKEYQTEAIVWRGGREEEERERESDQEHSLSTQPDDAPRAAGILKEDGGQNGCISSTPAPAADPVTLDPAPSAEEPKHKEHAQTLSELKKQRAAAKLLTHPVLNGHLGNGSTRASPEDPRMPLVSSNGSAVYFTPASGDPPLLRFMQPIEDEDPKSDSCCCIS
ncbi:protein phosphatase 1 regulatory inhibitor subunit 16B [Sinocyclocheilus grahami]|uniref:protein phosphatase 1 regulatory inhibitor subunit 16B n=1 Tax=Sinocyclocheilus grahami TaxID=75366 RepID=UPI0007ACED31|nr:PREDICTED: protein phosphatase 1 regulatory inhibitor subunit 16B-like [Sinocyclocheilus grahami]